MAELEKLINTPMEDLKYLQLGKEYQPTDKKKTIDNEKERQDVIDNLTKGRHMVKVWANCDFTVDDGGIPVEIKKGENQFTPTFAIFLLRLYGINNKYGALAKIRNNWIHDEPVFVTPFGEKCDFTAKKAAKAE